MNAPLILYLCMGVPKCTVAQKYGQTVITNILFLCYTMVDMFSRCLL